MTRWDMILAALIITGAVAWVGIFLYATGTAAHGSVFDVTDPDRGLYRMHPALVKEQP